ncbi:MAG: flagellar hook-basal body complex protein [Candidatus Margulisbacteria bacterium]|nr:flagellar hook-basal body complex protein [Candidatus Margulisiibacteriota bacterium]
MIPQLNIAKSATFALERQMQVISDNIANVSTVGHKAQSMQFENMFPIVFERVIAEFDEEGQGKGKTRKTYNEMGQGVHISQIVKNMQQGTIEVTNQPLDLAVQGNGFLQFRLPEGAIAYSRAGNLHQDKDGNVLSPGGYPLEPPIRIPQNTTNIIVNDQGRVYVQLSGDPNPQEIGQVTLAIFQNPEGVREIGQNLYVQTEASGDASLQEPGSEAAGTIRQRSLEFSNVNIVEELLQMMVVQRSFDIAVKAIKASDKILQTGADIK